MFEEENRNTVQRQPYQIRAFTNDLAEDSTTVIGPIVIVAKATTKDIVEDSFDGDNDGKLDVKEAFDDWNAVTRTGVTANQEDEVSNFLLQIRNRAQVNGGSIGLRALVVSGRNRNNNFLTFASDTILITPCFPIVAEADQDLGTEYNFDVYAAAAKVNAVDEENNALIANRGISFTQFIESGSLANNDIVFKDSEGPFELIREGSGERVAQFVVESCARFSYFA